MTEDETAIFDIQKYYKKNELKNIQNDSWFDKFWLRSIIFDLKSKTSIILGGNF